jgi:hypothetical protein
MKLDLRIASRLESSWYHCKLLRLKESNAYTTTKEGNKVAIQSQVTRSLALPRNNTKATTDELTRKYVITHFSAFSALPLGPLSFSLISSNTLYSQFTEAPTISFKIRLIPKPFLPSLPCRFQTLNTSSPFLTLSVIPVTSSSPTSLNASPMSARISCSHNRPDKFLRRCAVHFPPSKWEACSHVGEIGWRKSE